MHGSLDPDERVLGEITDQSKPSTATKAWQAWKYSLGSFSDHKTKPYDNLVAIIRTVIFVSVLSTNAFIVSGVIRHWNDIPNYNYENSNTGRLSEGR